MKDVVIKRNNPNVKTTIDSAIALCNVVNEYDEFHNNIVNYISKHEINLKKLHLEKLQQMADGKKVHFNKKIKQFYLENKKVINKINKYMPISEYIFINYVPQHLKEEKASNIFFLYMYLYENQNKNQICLILKNLKKLKSLGVKEIYFDEECKFEHETAQIYTIPNLNDVIPYYDSIETIPSDKHNMVKYKPEGASYKMELCNGEDGEVIIENIILNNLTFDSDKLPSRLVREQTVEKIISSKKENRDLLNSIILKDNITIIERELSKLENTANSVSHYNTKLELLNEIKKMCESLKKIKNTYNTYNNVVSFNNDDTKDTVKEVKKLELK